VNWLILVFAAAALAGAGACIWWRSRIGKELALMRQTDTSNARDIAGKAPGTLVELKGVFRADQLLKSEFAGRDCVYYRALVERQVEYYTRDSKVASRRETRYETVSSTERHAACVLEDASGSVPVDFTGAKVEGVQVHQRYETGGLMNQVVSGVVGSVLGSVGTGNTLGHRYTEWIIAAGEPAYVLGTVLPSKAVGASPAKTDPFIISHKTEEERTRSLTWNRRWLVIGAIALVALAAGLVWLYFRTA